MFTAIHMHERLDEQVFGMSRRPSAYLLLQRILPVAERWADQSAHLFVYALWGPVHQSHLGSDDLRGLFELLVHLDHPGYHP
jgi:hypothetical protein